MRDGLIESDTRNDHRPVRETGGVHLAKLGAVFSESL
jgi:hypothetical protein